MIKKKQALESRFSCIVAFVGFASSIAAFVLYTVLELKPAAVAERVFYLLGSSASDSEFKLFLVMISVVFCCIASRSLCDLMRVERRKVVMAFAMCYSLAIYLFLIANMTLINPLYGRNPANILNWLEWDRSEILSYIDRATNFVPFYTLKLFYKGWIQGNVTTKDAFVNLIGNFFAFSPLAFFLPPLLKRARRLKGFFWITLSFACAIEVLQLILMTGSLDVDDIFFNVAGAIVVYAVLHIKAVKSNIIRLTLLEY
jgi:glycopeptide antibiotics resistance protein